MSPTARSHLVRIFALGHLTRGAALLVHPEVVDRTSSGQVPPPWVVRALGLRLLAQGVIETLWPRRATLRFSCAIDVAHAASMFGAAVMLQPYRRAALASATGGAASAAAAGMILRNWL